MCIVGLRPTTHINQVNPTILKILIQTKGQWTLSLSHPWNVGTRTSKRKFKTKEPILTISKIMIPILGIPKILKIMIHPGHPENHEKHDQKRPHLKKDAVSHNFVLC